MAIHSIHGADVRDKRVLIRFDGDVPIENNKIMDDYRLKAVLPTIQFCREQKASVVLMAHRGRPKNDKDKEFSLEILTDYFRSTFNEEVEFISSLINPVVHKPIALLENLRFHEGEEQNDHGFAHLLSRFGDIYCNDAFAVSHRAHASVDSIAGILPHYAGIRFIQEVKALNPLRAQAEEPYVVVLGGVKANDKSPIIRSLVDKVDGLIIGGLVAVTYWAAMGYNIGAHQVESEQVKIAQDCIKLMNERQVEFYIPTDFINQENQVKAIADITATDLMLDIGPATQACFAKVIDKANTVFWNGAMGKFEDTTYANGTLAIARAMADSEAEVRVASGGDTVSAIHQHNLSNAFTFISTGGGATLEFIAGEELPGIKALES